MMEHYSYIVLNLTFKLRVNFIKICVNYLALIHFTNIDPQQHLFFHLLAVICLLNNFFSLHTHTHTTFLYTLLHFNCLLVLLSLTDVRCYFEHAKASKRLQSFLFSLHSLISGKASHLSVTQSDCSCQLCTKRNQFGSGDTSIFLLSLKQTRFDC